RRRAYDACARAMAWSRRKVGASSQASTVLDLARRARPPVRSVRLFPRYAARSALGPHAHQRRHRVIASRPLVLGVPFGTGSAHVIEFRPIVVEQASG